MAYKKGQSDKKGKLSTSDHVRARQEKRSEKGSSNGIMSGAPKSIHDVFEYATEQEEMKNGRSRKGAQRRLQRAIVDDSEFNRASSSKRSLIDDASDDDEKSDRRQANNSRPDYGTAPILDDDEGQDYHGRDIASEDDEEIDSDEAFDESDEERYADWKFASDKRKGKDKGRKNIKYAEEDEDRDEEESDVDSSDENDDDDADMMDLSRMLDVDDGQISDEEEDDDDLSDDDDKLQRHIDAFSKGQSKRDVDSAAFESGDSSKRRRLLQDRTEAVPEGEWNAPVRRDGTGLTIDDLLKPISEQSGTSLTALRNTAKALRPSSSADANEKQALASKKGGGALQAPLPTIVQDRLDRSAAYGETKAEVEGWQPTIKRLREAQHLSFPLQPDPIVRPSTSALAGNFQVSNDFEKDIATLLEREGATEKQMARSEELEMNKRGMSAEEIKMRTAELRRMRELLFRQEQKAKRISKIKSKTYRRIARKQKQRDEEKARQAGLLVDGEDDDDEARLQAERARAKERATLKHKNAGKWAKDAIGMKGVHDMPETRRAIEEQLLRGEQLRKRIQGEDSDDDDEYSDDESDSKEEDGESIRQKAFDEMASVRGSAGTEDISKNDEGKGIWNMKFMQKARERHEKDAIEQMDAFDRELQQEENSEEDEIQAKSMQIGNNSGRRVFSAKNNARKVESNQEGEEGDGEEEIVHRPKEYKPLTSTSSVSIQVEDIRPKKKEGVINAHDALKDVNPWMVNASDSNKVSRKRNEAMVSKDSSTFSKANNRVQKHAAKNEDVRIAEQEDGELTIDPEARMTLRIDSKPKEKPSKKQIVEENGYDDSDDSDEEDEAVEISTHAPKTTIQQRQLVAEAFAGDDVLADFAAEKQAAIDAEKPKELDTFLPGWGSWSGKGVKTSKKQREERKNRFTKMTSGLDPSKRKDAGMSNVIINQKRDKKAEKFKSDDVPYPYTSRAQYEMAMRNPLGPEWNTRTQHQRMTLPKVLTKPGKVIRPIEKLF